MIGTNFSIAGLKAAAALRSAMNDSATANQRLATGLKLNSAADGPGDILKVSRLTSEIRELAQKTAVTLVSKQLIETADAAHSVVSDTLQSMTDYANSASTSTATGSEREDYQSAVSVLITELDDISANTTFSGKNLLDGTFTSQNLGTGSGNSAVTVSISSTASGTLGTNTVTLATKAGADAAAVTADGAFTLTGTAASNIDYDAGASAYDIAALITAAEDTTGVSAVAATKGKIKSLSAAGTISFNLNGVATGDIVVSSTDDLSAITTAINAISSSTNIYAETGTSNDEVILTSSTGQNILLTAFNTNQSGTNTVAFVGLDRAEVEVSTETISNIDGGSNAKAAVRGYVVLNSDENFSYAMTAAAGTDFSSASSSFASVSAIDVSSRSGALNALDVLSTASEKIAGARTVLGGISNRLDFMNSHSTRTSLTLSAARGNLVDADMALESARLAKANILAEAATAMIAQANLSRELVLQLFNSPYARS